MFDAIKISIDIDRLVLQDTFSEKIDLSVMSKISYFKCSPNNKERIDINAPVVASLTLKGWFPSRVIKSGGCFGSIMEIIDCELFQILNLRCLYSFKISIRFMT